MKLLVKTILKLIITGVQEELLKGRASGHAPERGGRAPALEGHQGSLVKLKQ